MYEVLNLGYAEVLRSNYKIASVDKNKAMIAFGSDCGIARLFDDSNIIIFYDVISSEQKPLLLIERIDRDKENANHEMLMEIRDRGYLEELPDFNVEFRYSMDNSYLDMHVLTNKIVSR